MHLPGRDSFPRVDDHLIEPEVTRDEIIGGRRVIALPANPPHANQQSDLDYVLRAHVAPGYLTAADLLTRLDEDSLAADSLIEDPSLVAPLAVAALLDAAVADNAVVEALAAKGNPAIQRSSMAKELFPSGRRTLIMSQVPNAFERECILYRIRSKPT